MNLARIDLTQNPPVVIADSEPWARNVMATIPPSCWANLIDQGYPGVGYWPIIQETPQFDPTYQALGAAMQTVDTVNQQVINSFTVVALSLAQVIEIKLGALDAYAYQYEQGGTTVSGQHWDTDDVTQAKLTAAYNLSQLAQSPAVFNWQMSTGFVQFSKAQIQAAAPALGVWVEAVFTNAMTHAAAIQALTTAAEVIAYDFTTGWPQGT